MTRQILNECEQQLCDAVDSAFSEYQVPWFQRLVEQPSYTRAREDVEAAAAIIDELADEIGLRRRLVPDPQNVFADHRVFATPGTGDDDLAIALVGHCDTVYPRSQGFLEFLRDGPDSPSCGDNVNGPGVLDMKSGLSVILFGLRALALADRERFDRLRLRFVCNTDEEVGSPDSHRLFDELASKTNIALVFEGGREGDRVITARKGTGFFNVTANGREAHAGNDHADGVNAIHALALLIPHIESLTHYDLGTTVNVGVFEGGTAKNTVPAQAHCMIDVRISTMEQMRHVQSRLQEFVNWSFEGSEKVAPRIRQANFTLEGGIRRPPMEPTEATQRLREAYEPFAAKMGLGTGEAPPQGGGSDANLLAAHGVPTIDGLGPYGKHLHSTREWSSLESLKKRTKALACFLASDLDLESLANVGQRFGGKSSDARTRSAPQV